MVELGSGSMPHRGKGIVGWHMDRSSEKCSTRERQAKGYQENVQNVERCMAEYWGRESEYT